MTVRVIKVQYQKRCAECEDWVTVGSGGIYRSDTKELWHKACAPQAQPDSDIDKQHELADRLGFRKEEI